MIQRFSSSYVNTKDNFVLIYDDGKRNDSKFKASSLYGIYCVVRNIIQRGQPTRLSEYLKENLDYFDAEELVSFISGAETSWAPVIKGDTEHSDYPALVFFNEFLPQYLGDEYGFVRNLIIPEADFEDVVGEKTDFSGQSVDFYLPQAHLVIEIDGYSHNDQAQIRKDKARDTELRRHRINVARVKASDIKGRTQSLDYELRRIYRIITSSAEVNEYKAAFENEPDPAKIKADTVMRLQQVLLMSLMEQILNIDETSWRVCIIDSDVDEIDELITHAFNDLKLWISAIAELLRIDISFPKLIFLDDPKDADLVLNYSIYKRYDAGCDPRGNEVIVRTDYYFGMDHFKVAVSKTLDYDIDPENNSEDIRNLEFLLRNIFACEDITTFNRGQLPIILNALNGKDTVGILPTGAGKSLCYQFTAFLQPGITIVVAPLISLMIDQKRSMNEKYGITHNNMISSIDDGATKGSTIRKFGEGGYQIMWISPERFQNQAFRESLSQINEEHNICLAVIDEVHCLSEWGHDFRVSYLTLIKTLRSYCPTATILGLTATASEFVLKDIRAEFGIGRALSAENVITAYSMDRDELIFKRAFAVDDNHRDFILRSIVKNEYDKPGAIFCKTISSNSYSSTSCRDVVSLLTRKDQNGESAIDPEDVRLFHGKMDQKTRFQNQKDFLDNKFSVIVCTKAFGMGIDKQNLRYTVHNSLPSSAESFYQEAGRAGRDGAEAHCYILYDVDEKVRDIVKIYSDSGKMLNLIEGEAMLPPSDFNTTLYFMRTNHNKEDEESAFINSIYRSLTGITVIPFYDKGEASKQKIEQALYKLSLLGIVEDWTVNYASLVDGDCVVSSVSIDNLSYERVLSTFINYVRKYDPEFQIEDNKDYADLIDNETKDIRNIIRMLVRWTNMNIIYNRIQCSKTMMDWCSPDVDDDTFRHNLEGYFRFNEETAVLEYIAENPKEWEEWFKLFFRFDHAKTNDFVMIDKETAKKDHASLQRFLESYQNNTGLNYLDGLLQALYKEELNSFDLIRMERSMEVIKGMDLEIQRDIIQSTLAIAMGIGNQSTRDMLSKTIIEHFPEYSRWVYESIHDRFSLMIELEKQLKKLEAIEWTI